ncbi:hypothetical protein RYZ26_06570 [Terasakiella sp. A23]|uniref:hypothetical protein n=1 Tax=Terasakiella sp. FCG-A23 TaxID=3080561 RepID=UPI00295316FB|nr:hypothetical protein [Terasakiella sp. A23]MDV7339249.1 hypothetical protein [Terasakiella sp. A23]
MNTSSKVILSVVGLGVVAFGGLKLAENKIESALRMDADRMIEEARNDGAELSVGPIKVDLLSRTVVTQDTKYSIVQDAVKVSLLAKEITASGFDIMQVINQPEVVDFETMSVVDIVVDAVTTNEEGQKETVLLNVDNITLAGSNLGSLSPEFEKADELEFAELVELSKKIKADKLTLTGLDMKGTGYEGSKVDMTLSTIDVNQIFSGTFKDFAMRDTAISIEGKKAVTINEILYESDNFIEDIATKALMRMNGLEIIIPEEEKPEEFDAVMKKMGLDSIVLNTRMEFDWDLEKQILAYKDFSFEMKDAVKVSLAATIADTPNFEKLKEIQKVFMSYQEGDEMPQEFGAVLEQLSFKDLSLSVEDKNLIGTLLDIQAEKENTSKDMLIMGAAMMSQAVMSEFVGAETATKISTDLSSMLNKGGEFAISIKANEGQSLKFAEAIPMAMIMPQAIFEQITVTSSYK